MDLNIRFVVMVSLIALVIQVWVSAQTTLVVHQRVRLIDLHKQVVPVVVHLQLFRKKALMVFKLALVLIIQQFIVLLMLTVCATAFLPVIFLVAAPLIERVQQKADAVLEV